MIILLPAAKEFHDMWVLPKRPQDPGFLHLLCAIFLTQEPRLAALDGPDLRLFLVVPR